MNKYVLVYTFYIRTRICVLRIRLRETNNQFLTANLFLLTISTHKVTAFFCGFSVKWFTVCVLVDACDGY